MASLTKTLYFHIGHFKTGTSAIQAFMAANAQRLARLGITYPELHQHYAKHSDLAFAIYRAAKVTTLMHGYCSDVRPEKVWDAMIAAAQADPAPITVISSEEFMRMGAHPQAVDILRNLGRRPRAGVDIRIAAWLRAPDAHLRSWYNQLVKMQVALPDYNTTVRQVIEPVHYDYALALRPWVDIFGADAVQVYPYCDALREGHRMYEDFLLALGIDMGGKLDRWWFPEADTNPRLDDRLVELTRIMHTCGLTDQDIAWAHERASKQFEAEMRYARPEPRSFDTVASRAAAGLDYVADLPGNRVDVSLFRQNVPMPNDPLQAEMTRFLGLLIDDVQGLRLRLHQRISEVDQRVTALESMLRANVRSK